MQQFSTDPRGIVTASDFDMLGDTLDTIDAFTDGEKRQGATRKDKVPATLTISISCRMHCINTVICYVLLPWDVPGE
jgi:hypothetical protein